MSITRFQTEEECATSEHVGRDTAAQLHAREHKHKAAQPPSLRTQSQLKTTEVWGWGWGEQSSVFTENTKTGYRVCALLCHECGTQRPYEDVTLYICTLTIKACGTLKTGQKIHFSASRSAKKHGVRHFLLRDGSEEKPKRWRFG